MIFATIIADTTWNGHRITTIHARYPRYIHSQIKTHRLLSTNSRSSRAVPTKQFLKEIVRNPVVPIRWGTAGKGMSDHGQLDPIKKFLCKRLWLFARWPMIAVVLILQQLGLAKEVRNRLLEPWMWIDTLITFTSKAPSWLNNWMVEIDVLKSFMALRNHKDAQPDIQYLAMMLGIAVSRSKPREHPRHYPYHHTYLGYTDREIAMISSARCARISYKPFDSVVADTKKDLALARRLWVSKHLSPFEHAAEAKDGVYGNKIGWCDLRKELEHESA